jgi:hypothetical protein
VIVRVAFGRRIVKPTSADDVTSAI